MTKVSITSSIAVDFPYEWKEQVPVSVHPRHHNIDDKVFMVYIKDWFNGKYDYYIGEAIVDGIHRSRRLISRSDRFVHILTHDYSYLLTDIKGNPIPDDINEKWFGQLQVFSSKEAAILNMREVALSMLERDHQRAVRRLAETDSTIQQLKDDTIKLRYTEI